MAAITLTVAAIREITVPILRHHGARKAGLFGSAARGELGPSSDIDILVELDDRLSLLEIIRLQHELEDALGCKVDLVEYATIKPGIREQILREEISLL